MTVRTFVNSIYTPGQVSFLYYASSSPTVLSVVPNTGFGGDIIRVSGTWFSPVPSENTVTFGEARPCAPVSVTNNASVSYLDCIMFAAPANKTAHAVSVHVHAKGNAYPCQGTGCFLRPLLVLFGSSMDRVGFGGSELTLTGKGFCDTSQRDLCKVTVCGHTCNLIHTNYTHITCLAPSLLDTGLNNVTCDVQVFVDDVESTNITLTYDRSITPRVSYVNASEGSTSGGTVLQLAAEGIR